MKSIRTWRVVALAVTIISLCRLHAQVSVVSNNPPAGSYVGQMGPNGNPVEIRHNGNHPIEFFTDSIRRMQLYPINSTVLNTFNVPRTGFVGISPIEPFFGNPGPFSRLHLADSASTSVVYAQDFGFRPWMRNGVTMSGNSDQLYMGQKYAYVDSTDYTSGEINDRSDAVIEWSDNPGDAPWGTDRLRFMFTNAYNVAAPPVGGAQSLEGLEAMRIYIPNDNEANVGVGDFFQAGVLNGQNEDPTERLHVRNGRVRIQQLPDDPPPDSDFVVMVVDTSSTSERGVVKWVPASTLLSLADCEWSMSTTSPNHVYTAVGAPDPNCPDDAEGVAIGLVTPLAKLDVLSSLFADGLHVNNTMATANVRGAYVQASGGTGGTAAIVAEVTGASPSNYGVASLASGATSGNIGVLTISSGSGVNNIGVSSTCNSASTSNTGFYGSVSGTATRNMGSRVAVSGGTTANIGDSLVVSGSAASNRGIVLSTSGATAANTGIIGTVSGTATNNAGVNFTVTGGSTTNTGSSLTVSGTSNANTGCAVVNRDALDNRGVDVRASSAATSAKNYGVIINDTTFNETSENRGVDVTLVGRADRSRGVNVDNWCTNTGGGSNHTMYGGYFQNHGASFLYSYGVDGYSEGAPSSGGVSRGVMGRALGTGTTTAEKIPAFTA